MRRAFGMRAYTVGLLSAALVGAGLTSAVSSPQPAAAGVIERRMDAAEPSVPGQGAPQVRPAADPDEAVNTARRPRPAVKLPPAVTVARPVEPQATLGVGLPADGVPVEVAVEPAGVPAAAGTRLTSLAQGSQVSVSSLGKEPATRLGSGVLAFRVAAPASGAVRARVDYSGFAKAYGGDFAGRLQLWSYPACALTTPQVETCLRGTQVPASNDTAKQALTASVGVDAAVADPSSGVVYVLAAGSSSGNGNYRATTLSPAGSWAVGEQSGSFTYSYPLPAAPSVGGEAPALALGYDSGSIDGRTSATNPQASWVGSGWDIDTGYIERRYRPCVDDGHPTWGDLCWHSPYSDPAQAPMVLSVGGRTTELIWEAPANSWRARDDAGWRITRRTGASNGDNDGEYWIAQAPDGTQYWFGRGTQPVTNRTTSSVATVPVFGDDAGEPTCSANANGYCVQGYRWMLDLVLDPNENSTTYFYIGEEQWYSIRGDTTPAHGYIRHVRLARAEYGEEQNFQSENPPARVLFDTVPRCTEATEQTDPLNGTLAECTTVAASPNSFPDVPVDLICRNASCSAAQTSPSFFTIYRLTAVRSQVWNPTLATAGYENVDRVVVRSTFPDPGDGTDPSLWVDFVQRRGYTGADVSTPAVNFQGANYANRVDWNGTNKKINMRRVVQVINGMGGRIDVTYGRPNACPDTGTAGSGWAAWYATVNGQWDTNTKDCYPVWFDPDGVGSTPGGFGIFHKYLVSKVDLVDNVGGSPTETTSYTYGGTPAWRHQEDMTLVSNQTWNQWRGYGTVTVRHGATATNRTVTEKKFFRGMHGDRNADGTSKTVDVTDFRGDTWPDSPSLAGRLLQTRTLDAAGTTELAASAHHYWRGQKVDGPGWHDSNTVGEDRVYTRERVTAETTSGADSWRQRQVDRVFNTYGLTVEETERGDDLVYDTDDRCVATTYAQYVDAVGGWNYHVSRPADVRSYHGPCSTGVLTGRVETLYDGAASTDPAVNKPIHGNPTATLTYTSATEKVRDEATYDEYGRLLSTTSPNEVGAATPKRTTITYAPATGYPVDGITETNPRGHTTTVYPSRYHGEALRTRDANNRWTHVAYDAFARPTAVWMPTEGGTSATPTGPASQTFTYPATATSPVSVTTPRRVTTEQLQSGGPYPVYLPSHLYVDGFGRERETQEPSPSGSGRTVTVTRYDDRGLPAVQSPPQFNSAAAGSGLLNPAMASLTSYTQIAYDDRARAWRSRHFTGGSTTPDRTSTTIDKGNRVEVTPTRGERTVTYTDTFGRTKRIKKYSSATESADTTYAYSYNAGGSRVDVTDPHSAVTSFLDDLAGRRWRVIDPNAGTTEHWYDDNGNLVQTRDPGGTIRTDYDELDRSTIRRATPPGGAASEEYVSATWAYDPSGASGQLAYADSTTRSTVGGGTLDLTVRTQPTGYDARYRPIGTRTTLPVNTALGALSGVSYQENHAYDAADHLITVDHPAIGGLPVETATVGYSAYGTPTHMTLHQGTTPTPVVSSVTWTGSGQFDKRFFASGAIRDVDWDESWRAPRDVATYHQPAGGGSPFFWQLDTYARDAGGNVTSILDQAQAPAQAQCFAYDTWNRLTNARTTNPAVTPCSTSPADTDTTWSTGVAPYRARWSYTANDDIATQTTAAISGSSAVWTNRTYARADSSHPSAVTRIEPSTGATTGADTFGYDGAGRMTARSVNGTAQDLTWSPANGLVSLTGTGGPGAGQTHRFAYDVDGQRVLKLGLTSVTAYFGATEVTAQGSTLIGTRYYTQGGSNVAVRTGNAPLRYLVDDVQGSATLVIDSGTPASAAVNRQRYSPYGAVRGSANQLSIERGWLGQVEDDATGLTYLNARYYDPAVGRFLSPDPVLRPTDPQTLNPYSYARNNPLTLADPSGLEPGSWCAPGAGMSNAQASACGVANRYTQTSHPMEAGQDARGVTRKKPRPDLPGDDAEIYAKAVVQYRGKNDVDPNLPAPGDGAALYAAAFNSAKSGNYNVDNCQGCTFNTPTPPGARELAEILGIYDIGRCLGGSISGCGWAAMAIVPVGRFGKAARVIFIADKAATPAIHMGKQGKHIPGHNNFEPGRSELTADPHELVKRAGTGSQAGDKARGRAGFKERIDFGDQEIGTFVAKDGTRKPTTVGMLHYDRSGSVHIVPVAPRQ